MPWKKTPPEIAAAFEKAKPTDPAVVSRPMFGYPSVFLNGNHFAGTFQDKIVVRLSAEDRARAMKAGATPFEPMAGRPMKEYVVVPTRDVGKPVALAGWIERARVHATTLPAKTKAARTKAVKGGTAKRS